MDIRIEFYRIDQSTGYEDAKDTGSVRVLTCVGQEAALQQLYVIQEVADSFDDLGYNNLGFRVTIEGTLRSCDQLVSWMGLKRLIAGCEKYDKPERGVTILLWNGDVASIEQVVASHIKGELAGDCYYSAYRLTETNYTALSHNLQSMAQEWQYEKEAVVIDTHTGVVIMQFHTHKWPEWEAVFPEEKEYTITFTQKYEYEKVVKVMANSESHAYIKADVMAEDDAAVPMHTTSEGWVMKDEEYNREVS